MAVRLVDAAEVAHDAPDAVAARRGVAIPGSVAPGASASPRLKAPTSVRVIVGGDVDESRRRRAGLRAGPRAADQDRERAPDAGRSGRARGSTCTPAADPRASPRHHRSRGRLRTAEHAHGARRRIGRRASTSRCERVGARHAGGSAPCGPVSFRAFASFFAHSSTDRPIEALGTRRGDLVDVAEVAQRESRAIDRDAEARAQLEARASPDVNARERRWSRRVPGREARTRRAPRPRTWPRGGCPRTRRNRRGRAGAEERRRRTSAREAPHAW